MRVRASEEFRVQHAGQREVVCVDFAASALPQALWFPVSASQHGEVIRVQAFQVGRIGGAEGLQGVEFFGVHGLSLPP